VYWPDHVPEVRREEQPHRFFDQKMICLYCVYTFCCCI
jgi:hypothetical protein